MLLSNASYAQYDSPVAYMSYFNTQEEELAKDYLGYMSSVTHSHNGRKMERRRQEVLNDVKEALQNTAKMKAYQGDVALRDAFKEYYSILLTVLNEDYAKILNMEEIAEQSYDNMEAYVLAQEKASERLDEAAKKRQATYGNFAGRNHIKLIESESKISRKLEQVGKVSFYYHQIYLVFFKSNKQEMYLVEAFNANSINAVEQNKSTLMKYSEEGLQKLTAVKAFENDYSLVEACRNMLEFYKTEAGKKVQPIMDYLMKKDEFDKIKRAFASKSEQQHTAADIEAYNKIVNDMNKEASTYNRVNQELNAMRSSLTDNWNKVVSRFLDTHSPK
jgi:hypothetical protein